MPAGLCKLEKMVRVMLSGFKHVRHAKVITRQGRLFNIKIDMLRLLYEDIRASIN